MMTVGKHDLDEPPAIVALLHGKRVPMVEIAGYLNGVRLGRATVKIHGPELRADPDLASTNEGVTVLWLK
jgi:hypothetical protein